VFDLAKKYRDREALKKDLFSMFIPINGGG